VFALRRFVALTAVAAVVSYVGIYSRAAAPYPIRSDGFSYYIYLPSWFLFHDSTLESAAVDCCGGAFPDFTGIQRWRETGRWVNPHGIGVAVLMSPFFGAAHALTRWSNLPADGFTLYYQHGAGLAGLVYMLVGLVALRRMLVREFSPAVALAALVTITWGTNLFHYGTFDTAFSHAYAFCLICWLVLLLGRWWSAPGYRVAGAIGALSALLLLTRPTNVIFLLLIPMYGVERWADVRTRIGALWTRRGELMIMAAVAAAGVLPQVLMQRRATGQWLVSPYRQVGVRFDFGSPQVFDVLFSTQKGLFFWSPLLLLSIAGLVFTFRRIELARRLRSATIAILALQTYLVASWGEWQFGGSYGHRAFIDGFGLNAVYLAAFFDWTARRERVRRFVAVVTALGILLSVLQMVQYWMGLVPIADTTWEQYRALFLRFR
jgi:hypothetical protein